MTIKAKCKAVKSLDFDKSKLAGQIGPGSRDRHGFDELDVDKEYVVWAVEPQEEGEVWLYLQAVEGHRWPTPYPSELFEIVDASIPSGWEIGFAQRARGIMLTRVSFAEWAHDESFYERLVDGEEEAVRRYIKEKDSIA